MKAKQFIRLGCLASAFSFFSFHAKAQLAGFSTLNREKVIAIERLMIADSNNFHSSCKPFALAEIPADSLLHPVPKQKTLRVIYEFGELSKHPEKFSYALSPVITCLPGYELSAKNAILETALGARVKLGYKNKWSAELALVNTNSNFSENWNNYAKQNRVMQGNGYAYNSDLGYTNFQAFGSLSYRPNKHFNFNAGR